MLRRALYRGGNDYRRLVRRVGVCGLLCLRIDDFCLAPRDIFVPRAARFVKRALHFGRMIQVGEVFVFNASGSV